MKPTFLTASACSTSDAATSLAEAALRSGFFERSVVLSTCGEHDFRGADCMLTSESLGHHQPFEKSFSVQERPLFALPFALSTILRSTDQLIFSDPHNVLLSEPSGLVSALEDYSLVLTSPILVSPVHDPNPLIASAAHTLTVDSGLFALSSPAVELVESWSEAMLQLVMDPNMTEPSTLFSGLVNSSASRADVGIEASSSLVGTVDYAELAVGRASAAQPAFVQAKHLWDITKNQESQSGTAEMQKETAFAEVHDMRPLEELLALMEPYVTVSETCDSAREDFVAGIRRSNDPFGHRWNPNSDELEEWLFERNASGLTRASHLYILSEPLLFEKFPGVVDQPEQYLAWHDAHVEDVLGYSLQLPTSKSVSLPLGNLEAALDDSGRWIPDAIRWRVTALKQLVPKSAPRAERRRARILYGPDLDGDRGLTPPKAIEVSPEPAAWPPQENPVSLIGCFRSESGLGEAARSSLSALRYLGRDFTYVDTSETFPSRNSISVGLASEHFGATGDVNLIHSNAHAMLGFRDSVFRHRLGGRFNAAMWFWETNDLPPRSRQAFELVDELWVASEYLTDVFGQYGRVPVRNIGLGVDLPGPLEGDRNRFGLDPDEFVFLFVYDALSSHGRKNPEKALAAFIKAFAPKFEGVRFVLKVSSLNKFPSTRDRICRLAAKYPAITVIDDTFGYEEVLQLMASVDVYVSLHAAEGFGLTILEAMALGTPVICTGYSGNMDFTTSKNSWLVDYSITAISEQMGPYPRGSMWASPNVDSAAEAMRSAAGDPTKLDRKRSLARAEALVSASIPAYANRLASELDRVS